MFTIASLRHSCLSLNQYSTCPTPHRDVAGHGVNSSSFPKAPIAPFEARGVDAIMRQRRAPTTEGNDAMPEERGFREGGSGMLVHERLEGQRPKDLKAWLEYRVR